MGMRTGPLRLRRHALEENDRLRSTLALFRIDINSRPATSKFIVDRAKIFVRRSQLVEARIGPIQSTSRAVPDWML